MQKHLFSLIFIVLFVSCNSHINETETRIIYELDQKHSDFIINHFEKRFNKESGFLDKFNFEKQHAQISNVKSDIGNLRVAFYTNRDVRCSRQFVSKTNSFFKLSDIYTIPIVFTQDAVYVKDKEKCLSSVLGGGKIFYIDTYNKTITWVTEM